MVTHQKTTNTSMSKKKIDSIITDFDFLVEAGYSVNGALGTLADVYDYEEGE